MNPNGDLFNLLSPHAQTVQDDRRRGGGGGGPGGGGGGAIGIVSSASSGGGVGGIGNNIGGIAGGGGRGREDPRRHTLGGDMLGYAHQGPGLPLQRSMDLEVMHSGRTHADNIRLGCCDKDDCAAVTAPNAPQYNRDTVHNYTSVMV